MWPKTTDEIVQAEESKFVVMKMPDISYVNNPGFFRIVWQKDGQPYFSGDRNVHITLDHSLVILNIPLSLNGSHFKVKLTHNPLNNVKETLSHDFILNITG